MNWTCRQTKCNVLQIEVQSFGGRYKVVKLLIDLGVNVDHRNILFDLALVSAYKKNVSAETK